MAHKKDPIQGQREVFIIACSFQNVHNYLGIQK